MRRLFCDAVCLFVLLFFLFAGQIHGGPEKRGHRLVTADLWDLNRFTKFFTERFLSKFALIRYAPCICCYTALWNINVGKTSINDKLLASVATFFRCGGVVNYHIKKGWLLSVWVNFFLNRWIFGKITSKSVVISCTARLANALLKDEESARDNHVFASTSAKYSPILWEG